MTRALDAKDLRTALQAIRAAADVMGEARAYMELHGELSGELGKEKSPVWPDARIVVTSTPEDDESDPALKPPAPTRLLLPEPGAGWR